MKNAKKLLLLLLSLVLLVGVFAVAALADDNAADAATVVYPDGSMDEVVYAKRHLVPFGEYVPWRPLIEVLIPPLTEINMLSSDFAPGEGTALVSTPFGKVGGLICFDSIYECLTLDSVRDGAELLVLPTNDSWFTDSAAVYMHSAQARLRAIESGRWIVRSADTGISSVIDPRGRSHEELAPLVEGMAPGSAASMATAIRRALATDLKQPSTMW